MSVLRQTALTRNFAVFSPGRPMARDDFKLKQISTGLPKNINRPNDRMLTSSNIAKTSPNLDKNVQLFTSSKWSGALLQFIMATVGDWAQYKRFSRYFLLF